MDALIVDCKTGLSTRRPFTEAEIDQRALDTAQAEADEAARLLEAQRKAEAIAKLKASTNKDTQDLLIALGFE